MFPVFLQLVSFLDTILGKEQMNVHSPLLVFSWSEIARQAAQIKMMRRLEKRALAQAAKEAKRQKGKASIHCTKWPHLVLKNQLSMSFRSPLVHIVWLLINLVCDCLVLSD